ncbi:MAG TPA: hypothetical protein VNZ64_18725 [Candidatus Acidoferrum sp.]|jgi:hypothetical protein|nr:hypothetical protein [Candidatus Acidoferrum sp.]
MSWAPGAVLPATMVLVSTNPSWGYRSSQQTAGIYHVLLDLATLKKEVARIAGGRLPENKSRRPDGSRSSFIAEMLVEAGQGINAGGSSYFMTGRSLNGIYSKYSTLFTRNTYVY